MSSISHNRAAYQHVNPNLRLGARRPVVNSTDNNDINRLIQDLRLAQSATSETALYVNLTTAYRRLRSVIERHRS